MYRYNILLEYSKDEQSSTDSRYETKEHINEHLSTNRTESNSESKAWFYHVQTQVCQQCQKTRARGWSHGRSQAGAANPCCGASTRTRSVQRRYSAFTLSAY